MIDYSLFLDASKRLSDFNIEHAFVECSSACRDIDIVLSPLDLDMAVWCLSAFLNSRGLLITKVVKKSYIRQIYFFDQDKSHEFNLDLMPEFSYRGVPYFTWHEIRVMFDEQSFPPVLKQDFVLYYKAVRRRLQSGVLTDHEFVSELACFGNSICEKVLSTEITKLLFIRFLAWSIQSRPLTSIRGLSMNLFFKFRDRLKIPCDI